MPTSTFEYHEKYGYLNGFNSYHETEAIKGTLPIGANSPQNPPYGLYAEKLSGSAFTAPRESNLQTWLYRIIPAAAHSPFQPYRTASSTKHPQQLHPELHQIPNQLRWDPFGFNEEYDWIEAFQLVARAGDPVMKSGIGISIIAAGKEMARNAAFYSADGDCLIVPQHGVLDIQTELGYLLVRPGEICVIPRGIRYRVSLPTGPIRAYVLELYEQGHFTLPELGPIGSNGLANARDFQAPVAAYQDVNEPWRVIAKFNNSLFVADQNSSPFNVIAWHGRYYPYKYDLGRFNTIGSISFDHPDPSIFTVLTAQSAMSGTAVADFVIFPPRWLVAQDTFRPPWYHRNTMSEFMGLISGAYDAKAAGFRPAGASLHNVMSSHGPDAETHHKASSAALAPEKVGTGSIAFMFESCYMIGVTEWGLKTGIQEDYSDQSWGSLISHFQPPPGDQELP